MPGCAFTDAAGTRHTIIFGVGIVSIRERTGVSVRDSRAIGLLAEPEAFSAGWVQRHTVSIDPNRVRDLIVSIDATPLSLKVVSHDPDATDLPSGNNDATKGRIE